MSVVHGAFAAHRVRRERHVRLFAGSDSAEERGLRYPHVVARVDRGTERNRKIHAGEAHRGRSGSFERRHSTQPEAPNRQVLAALRGQGEIGAMGRG